MGEVVQLSEYRCDAAAETQFDVEDSQVPIEFAVGLHDRQQCLEKIAEYGVRDVQINRINAEPDTYLYLMGVKDAIWLNKKILEREDISDEEIAQRIDLIQMLENTNLALMEAMWAAFTRPASFTPVQEGFQERAPEQVRELEE